MPKRQFLETFCFYKVSSPKLTKHQFTFYQKHRRKLLKELTRRGGKEDLPHHSPSPSPPSIRKGTWAKRVKGDAIRPWDDSKTAIASSAQKRSCHGETGENGGGFARNGLESGKRRFWMSRRGGKCRRKRHWRCAEKSADVCRKKCGTFDYKMRHFMLKTSVVFIAFFRIPHRAFRSMCKSRARRIRKRWLTFTQGTMGWQGGNERSVQGKRTDCTAKVNALWRR